jgi:ornithine--oxo-acid transaminase
LPIPPNYKYGLLTTKIILNQTNKGAVMSSAIEKAEQYGAKNYLPLDVVITKAERVWVWDEDGNKYLDMLAAYSAVNQGHCHPKIVKAAKEQLDKVTVTSRAFHNDRMGDMLEKLCNLAVLKKLCR